MRATAAAFAISLLTLAVMACPDASSNAAAPTVTLTSPTAAATGVATNTKLTATFSKPMAPLSTSTFTVKTGTTPVVGSVVASTDLTIATFTPAAALSASTLYSATITSAAKSTDGVALATDATWSFTTGTTADATPPTVTASFPRADATGVPVNVQVSVVFSEPIDSASVNQTSFTLTQQGKAVEGALATSYGTLTFRPTNALPSNTLLTATVTEAVKDLAGNSLAASFSWAFTTGNTTMAGPAVVSLGAAGNFVVLAKTAVSSVPPSVVTGSIGLGPAAASYVTGFSLVADASNVFSTSPQVTGHLYAADYAAPTPTNLTIAVSNMESAYVDAANRPAPDFLELATGNLGGRMLVPGLYKWTSSLTVPADVVISGGPNDVWVFQTTGDLSMSAAMRVTLAGGAQAKNIFWQVAGQVTLAAGAHLEGIVLCKTEVTLQTGSSLNGRILAQSQIALQQATVTAPPL
jgi:hypothetical protein